MSLIFLVQLEYLDNSAGQALSTESTEDASGQGIILYAEYG
jgi:hypothetical protein